MNPPRSAAGRAAPAVPVPVPLSVLGVASELYPLLKTGGLADVTGALPGALAPLGVTVRTLLPGHPSVMAALQDVQLIDTWPAWFGGPARLLAARCGALELLVLDAPHLYARHGNPYLDSTGHDWADNAERYGASTLDDRVANKRALEARFGLPADDAPLLCMVSRLTTQKGIDLVAQALDALVGAGVRLVVLGAGDASLEDALRAGAQRHPQRVAVHIGYDEAVSHLMQGGSDAILVPSRFEPCGLTQLYGLRYGCVPVVSRVGGLADTVIDANDAAVKAGVATGVQFPDVSTEGLLDAVRRTAALYRQPAAWRRMQTAGMGADVGWQTSAAEYAALYRRLCRTPETA